ncbi:glycosyltransferase family protein [Geminocystis sp. CENA526]|uniref:glycosyltransferase family protein n=1 Tax=Geminocystis sp. CENA526 TaxID=1355871 RepID=UPI003D6FB2E2
MRIFTAIKHSINPKYYYGGLWSSNFYPALTQLGHEIIESQVDLLPASHFLQIPKEYTPEEEKVRERITTSIIDEVRKAHQKEPIDLFLCYFYNAHFIPEGFEEIHQLGIPTINFYCNSIYQFELVKEIASKVTYSWHPEKDARELYLKVGANPIWVQMGADPEVYYPIQGIKRRKKACFVGQRYADRERLLSQLILNEIPVDIYGKGWTNQDSETNNQSSSEDSYLGRKKQTPGHLTSYVEVIKGNINQEGLFGGLARTLKQFQYRRETRHLLSILSNSACGFADNLSQTFAEYEIILNFSNVWADGRPGSKLIPHVRLRDFEAPMSGTCYITGYTEEIEEFYQLGKEIDTYNSVEELIDKTKFYLNHPTEAEKLRWAGYKRAISSHTWKNRFQELFKKIK